MRKECAEHGGGIGGERILAGAQAPIVHKGALAKGIRLNDFIGGDGINQLPALLPCPDCLNEKLKVGAIAV